MSFDEQSYEIWDDKQRLTVTLHEEHLPAFLRLAYGSEYRGHQSHGNHRRYLVGTGHEILCHQGLPLVMRTYHLGLKGAMLLSNRALDLLQQIVGEQGPALLPFVDGFTFKCVGEAPIEVKDSKTWVALSPAQLTALKSAPTGREEKHG